jgi:hypothetical protein
MTNNLQQKNLGVSKLMAATVHTFEIGTVFVYFYSLYVCVFQKNQELNRANGPIVSGAGLKQCG